VSQVDEITTNCMDADGQDDGALARFSAGRPPLIFPVVEVIHGGRPRRHAVALALLVTEECQAF
jgi:hypothetical protein